MVEAGIDELIAGIRAGDRTALGRAVTLVESTRPEDRRAAAALLERLLPCTGGAHRVGVTGVPGVGKSTLIDALGAMLTGRGRRVAVLAVDPTSPRTGGSILGDKTRMARLAADDGAFIRPSPSAGAPGGVTAATRQAITVVEAAGYDVVLVETVGVGQSETVVHGMVDTFVVLAPTDGGDGLQMIKRGVLELADAVAVTKADGAGEQPARLAAAEIRRALELAEPARPDWSPPVVTVSGVSGAGLEELWGRVVEHRETLEKSGELARKRAGQELAWLNELLRQRLLEQFEADPDLARRRAELTESVLAGETTALAAVEALLAPPE